MNSLVIFVVIPDGILGETPGTVLWRKTATRTEELPQTFVWRKL